MELDIEKLCDLAIEAGHAVMKVYKTEFDVEYKDDDSPLTKADRLSHEIIARGLGELYPDVPLISEEGKGIPYAERRVWPRFWLVDPLDGTKEFVKRNGDFTVNIALVEDTDVTAGVIYAPDRDTLYLAQRGKGAFRKAGEAEAGQIRTKKPPGEGRTVVQSRSHPSERLSKYLETIKVDATVKVGSSLKFCMVAEGSADLYPRLGPTWEWDTAAGHAIINEAGGSVLGLDGGALCYNKPDLLNSEFIVYA